jgi:hypothetical protein
MKKDGENSYKTRDIGEAAALMTCGLGIEAMQRDGKVCWFVFGHTKKCEDLSREYFFGNLQGNLRQYNEALNVLKNRIFS